MLSPDDLIVEVRDVTLARVGQLVTEDLDGLTSVPRLNAVGSWEITLPELTIDAQGREIPHALCAALREEGAGLIVSGPDGVILSGPMTEARFSASPEKPGGEWKITGVSDAIILQDALAYPSPAIADPGAQTKANDVRSGSAEDLLRDYVSANIGPAAPASRRVGFRSALVLDGPSLGRGGSFTASPRFDNLLTLAQTIAGASSLAFDVVQSGADLVFRVWEPADRSAFVRLDLDNGALQSVELGLGAPTSTRPIVAGQGEGVERAIVERTSADAASSELAWGRRIERFYDQRQTEDVAELEQAGDSVLAVEATTIPAVRIEPSDDLASVFLRDWGLGDLVTVTVGETSSVSRVTEAILAVSGPLVKTGVSVGDPTGFEAEDVESARVQSTEQRVSSLERNAEVKPAALVIEERAARGLLDPAYRGEGPAKVIFDGTSSLSAEAFEWLAPYVPTASRSVNLTVRGSTWVITGQSGESDRGGRVRIPLGTGWAPYNWSAAENGWAEPASTRLPSGLVVLSGLVRYGSGVPADASTIAVLPAGHRPPEQVVHFVSQSDTPKAITIHPDGRITVRTASYMSGGYVSLDGVAFWAAGVGTWTPIGEGGSSWGASFQRLIDWDETHGVPSFWKDPYGFVWMKGLARVKAAVSADNTPIFTLPTGYRPTSEMHIRTTGNDGYSGIGARADGTVNWKSGSVGTVGSWVSLYGACIPTADAYATNPWMDLPGFSNGWVRHGAVGQFPTPAFLRRGDGLCMTAGLITGGTLGSGRAFALNQEEVWPVGGRLLIDTIANNARGRLDIVGRAEHDSARTPGSAAFINGSNAWASLDSVKWVP